MDLENKLVGTSGKRVGEGQYMVDEEEGQTTMYKISYTNLLKTIGNIANIYSNYK